MSRPIGYSMREGSLYGSVVTCTGSDEGGFESSIEEVSKVP